MLAMYRKALHLVLFSCLVCMAGASLGERWPDLPVGAKQTAGARVGQIVYAGLGSAGKAWWGLDLSKSGAQWMPLADFPDQPRDGARAVAVGGQVYVFAGQGKATQTDQALMMFDSAYGYDPATNRWTKLPTRMPLGGLASAVVSLDDREVLFFGGVNKAIFDGYFQDYYVAAGGDAARQEAVAAAYFDQRPQDYLFTAQVLSYAPATNKWRNLGLDPGLPTAGAGVAVSGRLIDLVSGEIKPGLRSPEVKSIHVVGGALSWQSANLPAPSAGVAQDGLAGAYAGYSGKVLLAAGGTNFPGSWKQFLAGQNFAHKGLKKVWHDEIYARLDGAWRVVGRLPQAQAYGAYVQTDDGLLIIGGELQDGAVSKAVFELRWNGKGVEVVR